MTNEEKKLYESFSKMSYEELFNDVRVREDYSEELNQLICDLKVKHLIEQELLYGGPDLDMDEAFSRWPIEKQEGFLKELEEDWSEYYG